jgi:peptide/nickel transport system ATP-binding protein
MNNLIEVRGLKIRDQQGHTLVDDIHLDIKAKKVNVLIGESGSGKSLTAKALIQSLPSDIVATFQRYTYDGTAIQDIQNLLGKHIGYISQDYTHSFNDHMKLGKQLIAIYRQHFHVRKEIAKKHVLKALSWVELGDIDVMNRYRFSLSGGQLERVLIASVLMLHPQLIIADEPTSALDAITGHHIMDLIKHLADMHDVTLLVITHDLSHVFRFSDYISVIRQGHLIDHGNIDYFKNGNIEPYSQALFDKRTRLTQGDHDD